jgi:hypothetical protein
MGENFQLKWNDHHSIFFSTAEALCQGDHLTDVTLSCGKKEFSAHKLVLSICSTYFKELFSPRPDAKPRPANQAAIVYLKDVDPRHMELLMNFMYRGEINVEETELMELLGTAKGLQIRGLTDAGETSEEDDDAPPIPVHSESTSSNNHHRGAASTSSSHINKPAPKSIKRSKSPSTSQASTSGAKKIKQETSVGSAGVVQPDPAYAEDDYEQEEEEPVYVQDEGEEHLAAGGDEEGEYNMEDSGGEAMLYEGDLTTPEVSYRFTLLQKGYYNSLYKTVSGSQKILNK